MSLYRPKGSKRWWVRITVAGRKTRRSTGTEDREQALEFEQRERERLWRLHKLGERAAVRWASAAERWLNETTKRTKAKDELILEWFEERIKDEPLSAIDHEAIEELRKDALSDGMAHSTVDRHMALLRAILRKCAGEWRYIEHAPKVQMYRAPTPEPRWLTHEEFNRLLEHLPYHQRLAARFAVATGLRMRSMLALMWDRIDLKNKRLWIPGAQMKAGRTHGIPLSREALEVLRLLRALNPSGSHVFQWKGQPIDDCNTKAFQDALKAAKITGANWHSLRHTFASWAVQNGVTLHELMQLGGWSSYSMVLRYAHLAPDHLAHAAEKVVMKGAKQKSAQPRKKERNSSGSGA